MANIKDLKYTKSHEWVEFISEEQVAMGLTDYAQKKLSDIVFVNLPEEGDPVGVGDAVCDVESVKAVADIYSPVEGVVGAGNEELLDAPGLINESPYDAWIFKIDEVTKSEGLMDFDEYEAHCAAEDAAAEEGE